MKHLKWTALLLQGVAVTATGATLDPIMTKAISALPADPEVQMLTVEYAPGESSPVHRHNAHTFVYVLNGSVEMQVDGSEPVTLSPGQTFYESPADVHRVSRNASDTESAKFLVFFIKSAEAPATVPAQ